MSVVIIQALHHWSMGGRDGNSEIGADGLARECPKRFEEQHFSSAVWVIGS